VLPPILYDYSKCLFLQTYLIVPTVAEILKV
jgi:hypothetical protein